MLGLTGIHLQITRLDRMHRNTPHLRIQIIGKRHRPFLPLPFPPISSLPAHTLLLRHPIKVPLKLHIRQLVPLLILPVTVAMFLDGVVGQVDLCVAHVGEVELVGGGADIALAEEVGSEFAPCSGE